MAKFFAWLLLIAMTGAFISSFCVENNFTTYEKQLAEMRQPLPALNNLQFCDAQDSDGD